MHGRLTMYHLLSVRRINWFLRRCCFAIDIFDDIDIVYRFRFTHSFNNIFGINNTIDFWLPIFNNICNEFSHRDGHSNEYGDEVNVSNRFFYSIRVFFR